MVGEVSLVLVGELRARKKEQDRQESADQPARVVKKRESEKNRRSDEKTQPITNCCRKSEKIVDGQ